MGLLHRLLGRLPDSVQDPVLGPLARQDGQWTGQTCWEHSPRGFSLTINRADELPTASDRSAFQTLARDYPALRTGLQGALHALWTTAVDKAGPDQTAFGGSLDLWARITLQGVVLHQDGHADLIYGLDDPDPLDGAFIVSVLGHDVTPLEYVD